MPESKIKKIAQSLAGSGGIIASGADLLEKINSGTATWNEYIDVVSDFLISKGAPLTLIPIVYVNISGRIMVGAGEMLDLFNNAYKMMDEANWNFEQAYDNLINSLSEKLPSINSYTPLTPSEREGLANMINNGDLSALLYPSHRTKGNLSTILGNYDKTTDPLILDLNGDGVQTINLYDSDIFFDFNNTTDMKTNTGWISKEDGFLVYDRNSNLTGFAKF